MRKHFSETTAHQRIAYGAAAGGVVALLPLPLAAQSHGLLAWTVGATVYLGLAWWLALEFDAERTRARAQMQDASAPVLSVLLLLSVFASMAATATGRSMGKKGVEWGCCIKQYLCLRHGRQRARPPGAGTRWRSRHGHATASKKRGL